MEWLKNKSLKQSFFIISILFLCVGILLSALTFTFIVNLKNDIELKQQYELTMNENGEVVLFEHESNATNNNVRHNTVILIDILQFILPILLVVASLVVADITFYRVKLKKPLAILRQSAEYIEKQDLNFKIVKYAADEIGELSSAFEKMRLSLLDNNLELWKQMEERKRLNAAFAHDLRNPITVLKGSAKILRKRLGTDALIDENIVNSIDLITGYTQRIETYIEAMTSVQKLEDIHLAPQIITWKNLCNKLQNCISILGDNSNKTVTLSAFSGECEFYADIDIMQNVAENLVCNALRYAKTSVNVEVLLDKETVTLTVSDDGEGFPPTILRRGAAPFLRGEDNVSAEHFGMGLYICLLLCEKHDGALEIKNEKNGAKATAHFKIYENLR